MDLPSGVDGDLVPRSDGQTRVISRTVVHETFSSRRIGLFVDCTLERNFLGDPRLEVAGVRLVHEKDIWRLGAGGDIGTGSRNAVFDVWTGKGIGVERLDVENDGNDVQL